MPKTNATTMTVRLPLELGQQLNKMRNENNLPTAGAALKYWIEQEINERTQFDISELQNQQSKLFEMQKEIVKTFTQIIDSYSESEAWAIKANKKANTIAKTLRSKELIKEIQKIDKDDLNIKAIRNEQKKRTEKKLGRKNNNTEHIET